MQDKPAKPVTIARERSGRNTGADKGTSRIVTIFAGVHSVRWERRGQGLAYTAYAGRDGVKGWRTQRTLGGTGSRAGVHSVRWEGRGQGLAYTAYAGRDGVKGWRTQRTLGGTGSRAGVHSVRWEGRGQGLAYTAYAERDGVKGWRTLFENAIYGELQF